MVALRWSRAHLFNLKRINKIEIVGLKSLIF
jgi:hypothetical protein